MEEEHRMTQLESCQVGSTEVIVVQSLILCSRYTAILHKVRARCTKESGGICGHRCRHHTENSWRAGVGEKQTRPFRTQAEEQQLLSSTSPFHPIQDSCCYQRGPGRGCLYRVPAAT